MRELGFSSAIATPHVMKNVWDNNRVTIESSLDKVRKALSDASMNFPISAAAEYLMDGNISDILRSETLLTLKDKHVLVEMSYINPPIQLYQIIFDLQLAGYKPVLAHPERYYFYHKNFAEYQKLKHSGCAFQLNMLSVVGYYGAEVAEVAQQLLKKGMIDYVGSDIHHNKHITAFSGKVVLKDVVSLKEAISRNSFFGI